MTPFDYCRPKTLDEAVARLGAGEDIAVLSGGMTLIPTLKQRLAPVNELVDLGDIIELVGIHDEGGHIFIGGMTTHAAVATSPLVRDKLPGLASLASMIGDAQVRNRGTLGGSVANNDPAADYPAGLVALGASVVTNRRAIQAEAFFTGMFETALAPAEIVTGVRFPIALLCAYAKFPNPVSRYAMAGVFVVDGKSPRVAVTGAAPVVFRARAMETALAERFAPEALTPTMIHPEALISDMHGSAAYRAHLAFVMARRAVASLTGARSAPDAAPSLDRT